MKAYLIYRPVMDYEESMTPYFVTETSGSAQLMITHMIAEAKAFSKKLPSLDQDLDDQTWSNNNDKRNDMLKKRKWAYGIDLSRDLDQLDGSVEIMELEIK
jgi:hypothetical protein